MFTEESDYESDGSNSLDVSDDTDSNDISLSNLSHLVCSDDRDDSDASYFMCKFYNIYDNGCCRITWQIAMKDRSIRSIQEPISEMLIDKSEFNKAYGKFLQTLDGRDMTSYVDFFWRRSMVDCSCLEFIDRDTRLDIYDYLREEDLIPDMKLVHSGDWKFKKNQNKGKNQKIVPTV